VVSVQKINRALILLLVLVLYAYAVDSASVSLSAEEIENLVIKGEPLALLATWVLFVSLLALQRKRLFAMLASIKKRAWLQLLLIFLLALTLRELSPHTHRVYFDEDIYLDMAKQISLNLSSCLCDYGNATSCFRCEMMKWPAGHPFVFAVMFKLFGVSETLAFHFASLLGALSCVIIFLLAYLLSGNEKLSLYAALILALIPIHILWSSTVAAEPTLLFFTILAACFILLHRRMGSAASFATAVLSVVLALYVKSEAMVFLLPSLAAFALFTNPAEDLAKPKNLAAIAVAMLLLFPCALHFSYASKFESWGARGEKISLKYLAPNLAENTKFWLGYEHWNKGVWQGKQLYHPLAFTVLAMLGGFYLLKRNRIRIFALLFLWFFSFFVLYLFFYAGSVTYGVDVRYVLSQLPPFSLLAAFGLEAIETAARRIIPSRGAFYAACIIPIVFFLPYLSLIQTPANEIEEASDARAYHDFAVSFAKNFTEDCYFISHVSSIYSVLNKGHMQIWYVYRPEFNEIIRKNCVVFDEGEWCAIKVRESGSCGLFKNYELKLLARFNNTKHNKVYSFYRVLPTD